jgi:hypothetical protein
MNDHERFTKQMEESLAVLKSIADELEKYGVPLAKRDAIVGEARKLKMYAYQAGRSEERKTPS